MRFRYRMWTGALGKARMIAAWLFLGPDLVPLADQTRPKAERLPGNDLTRRNMLPRCLDIELGSEDVHGLPPEQQSRLVVPVGSPKLDLERRAQRVAEGRLERPQVLVECLTEGDVPVVVGGHIEVTSAGRSIPLKTVGRQDTLETGYVCGYHGLGSPALPNAQFGQGCLTAYLIYENIGASFPTAH